MMSIKLHKKDAKKAKGKKYQKKGERWIDLDIADRIIHDPFYRVLAQVFQDLTGIQTNYFNNSNSLVNSADVLDLACREPEIREAQNNGYLRQVKTGIDTPDAVSFRSNPVVAFHKLGLIMHRMLRAFGRIKQLPQTHYAYRKYLEALKDPLQALLEQDQFPQPYSGGMDTGHPYTVKDVLPHDHWVGEFYLFMLYEKGRLNIHPDPHAASTSEPRGKFDLQYQPRPGPASMSRNQCRLFGKWLGSFVSFYNNKRRSAHYLWLKLYEHLSEECRSDLSVSAANCITIYTTLTGMALNGNETACRILLSYTIALFIHRDFKMISRRINIPLDRFRSATEAVDYFGHEVVALWLYGGEPEDANAIFRDFIGEKFKIDDREARLYGETRSVDKLPYAEYMNLIRAIDFDRPVGFSKPGQSAQTQPLTAVSVPRSRPFARQPERAPPRSPREVAPTQAQAGLHVRNAPNTHRREHQSIEDIRKRLPRAEDRGQGSVYVVYPSGRRTIWGSSNVDGVEMTGRQQFDAALADEEARLIPIDNLYCGICKTQDHNTKDCTKKASHGRCFNCDKPGHLARDCPEPRKERSRTPSPAGPRRPSSGPVSDRAPVEPTPVARAHDVQTHAVQTRCSNPHCSDPRCPDHVGYDHFAERRSLLAANPDHPSEDEHYHEHHDHYQQHQQQATRGRDREYRSLFAFYEPGDNPYFSPALVAPGRRVHDCGLEMRPTEALYDEASRHSFAGRAAIRRFLHLHETEAVPSISVTPFHQVYGDGRSDLLSEAVLLPTCMGLVTFYLTPREMPMTLGRSTITAFRISVVPSAEDNAEYNSYFHGGTLKNRIISDDLIALDLEGSGVNDSLQFEGLILISWGLEADQSWEAAYPTSTFHFNTNPLAVQDVDHYATLVDQQAMPARPGQLYIVHFWGPYALHAACSISCQLRMYGRAVQVWSRDVRSLPFKPSAFPTSTLKIYSDDHLVVSALQKLWSTFQDGRNCATSIPLYYLGSEEVEIRRNQTFSLPFLLVEEPTNPDFSTSLRGEQSVGLDLPEILDILYFPSEFLQHARCEIELRFEKMRFVEPEERFQASRVWGVSLFIGDSPHAPADTFIFRPNVPLVHIRPMTPGTFRWEVHHCPSPRFVEQSDTGSYNVLVYPDPFLRNPPSRL